ncbi:GlxA family transcriptional regulator [Geomonas sp. Red32]|uniref:GlxA family transcriptional regulator n=1 Tax=Geomonas sp. Red32 TaxID=2912856 RepID=UPI00202CEEA3|nr:GlxA family transcriptional regulator [Geomonas sp. Red32]MCM0080481.1 GlxA family transcriptional regulator [Geomonas sp. Red32]
MKPTAHQNSKPNPIWRTVAVAAYEGAELLDITGPIEVFTMLNRCLDDQAGYRIVLLAEAPGSFPSSSGVRLVADAAWGDQLEEIDTIVVPGSPDDALDRALKNDRLIGWLRGADRKARRIVSVCTGAFLLAEAGLLDGRQVTTHWMDLDRLAACYPQLTVERDAIYVRQGNIATSAGVSAGIDLALALVEEDFGRHTALAVARRLVVYLKRPGGQAQFSTQLRAQMVDGGPLAPLLSRLRENPAARYTVESLADLCAMSPRNFARIFRKETGTTPARYLDQLRLEKAVGMLEEGTLPVAQVARECGFTCPEQLRRTFIRQAGISPIGYRKRFSRGEGA